MRTKELDISEYWGSPAKVTIRKLTYGQRSKLIAETTKTKIVGKNAITDTDVYALRIKYLLFGIEKAPFNIDQPSIEALDSDLGDFLFEEIDKLNTYPNLEETPTK